MKVNEMKENVEKRSGSSASDQFLKFRNFSERQQKSVEFVFCWFSFRRSRFRRSFSTANEIHVLRTRWAQRHFHRGSTRNPNWRRNALRSGAAVCRLCSVRKSSKFLCFSREKSSNEDKFCWFCRSKRDHSERNSSNLRSRTVLSFEHHDQTRRLARTRWRDDANVRRSQSQSCYVGFA